MAKSNHTIRNLFLEGILIMLSVLLAFFLNDWRETNQERKLSRQVLSVIHDEIEQNKNSVEKVIEYHRKVAARLDSIIASGEIEAGGNQMAFMNIIQKAAPYGLQPPDIRETAWQSALTSGATNQVKFDVLYNLSGIYELQNRGVKRTWPLIIDAVFSPDAFRPENTKARLLFLQLSAKELTSQENYLISRYKNILEKTDWENSLR